MCARMSLCELDTCLVEIHLHTQVDGQRGMDEVFAEIDGVLSAFSEDDTPKAASL